MAFRQIKAPALGTGSVIEGKLAPSAVSGQAAAVSVSSLDTFLFHSASNDALFKVTASDLIGSYTTDDLQEGTKKFFSAALAQAAVAQDIVDAVAAEATIARAAELVLTNDLAAEVTRATTAEGVNATAIATETTRATAEEARIDTAFQAADTALQAQIDNIISNVDPAALDSLTEIVAEFQNQDSVLSSAITANANAISAEVTRATTAEGVNATAIAAETVRATAAEATLTSDLTSEAATRLADDNALDARVTVNEGDIATLQSDLTAEIAATDAEVNTLTSDLAAEVTRATGSEAANAQAIADEATARATADTALDTAYKAADVATLTSAQNFATAADTALQTAMETYADTAEADAIADAVAQAEAKDVARAVTSDAADAALDARATVLESEMDDAELRLSNIEATSGGAAPLDTLAQTLAGGINELHTDTNAVELRVTIAEADIATNASDIANIISNTDPAALDSLTEIVTAFETADNAFTATLNANATDRAAIRTEFAAADLAIQTALNSEIALTDGEIAALQAADTNEVTNRVAGDAATLSSAQAYADTAEADAIATAAADATAKADAAQAAAEGFATAADTVLETALKSYADTAEADAIATAGTYTDQEVLAEKTRAEAAESAIQLQVTANAGEIADNATDIATNVAAISQESTDRAAADTTLTANLATEVSRATAAELVLTNDLAAEVTRATAAETANATAISNEVTRSTTIDATHTANIATNVQNIATNAAAITAEQGRAEAAEAALDTRVSAQESQVASILSNTDADALDSLTEIVAAFQTADGDINNAITNLSTTAATDRAAIRTEFALADSALDSRLTTEEGNVDALEAIVGSATLTTTSQTVTAAINELNAATSATTGGLQDEVDAIEAALGLAADGTFVAHSGSNYIDAATTGKGARELLDAAIKAEEVRATAAEGVLTTNVATNLATIDRHGLDIATNSANIATNVTAIATNAADIVSEASTARAAELVLTNDLAAEVTRATAAEGVNATAISAETARATAAEGVNAAASAANLVEITATQAGAGLALDGTYVAPTTSNYHNGAASLASADMLLDAAIKAEEVRATAAEGVLTADLTAEVTRATAAEGANATAIADETTRATAAEGVNATAIAGVATDLATEVARAEAAELVLTNDLAAEAARIDNIISNTDPAALDSLTEIVAQFQADDGDLLAAITSNDGEIAANAAAIIAEETRALAAEGALSTALAAEVAANDADHSAATSDRAAIRSEFAAADTTLQNNIDTKLALAGGTMSGDIAMSGSMVSGLGTATLPGDAVSKAVLDAALASSDIGTSTTNDLAEGTGPDANLYFTDARARSAISVVDTAGAGLVSYDSATGVISVDTNESVLDLTDVADSDYTGKAKYVLAVNDAADGMELRDPLSIFTSTGRQTIDGDGVATQYSLTIDATQSQAMVFVGGVIQDPATHYTINDSASTITFTAAIPVGTQAVVIAPAAGVEPVLIDGQVTKEKLSSDIKAFTQGLSVTAGNGGSVVDSFDGTKYRSAKYVIQVGDGAGNFETREALVVHDGTTAYITEYALVYTGSNLIGDASVNMNGTNVELTYSTSTGTADVKVISTYIDV